MQHNYSIKTEHLLLVPMNQSLSEEYRKLRNREDNRKFFFNSSVIKKEQQEIWFHRYLSNEREYMFSIILLNSKIHIGAIGIYNIDNSFKTGEIGRIVIDRDLVAGRGYGVESITAISQIAANELKLEKVYAYIYSNNSASRKSFIKAGFLPVDTDIYGNDIIKVKLKLT